MRLADSTRWSDRGLKGPIGKGPQVVYPLLEAQHQLPFWREHLNIHVTPHLLRACAIFGRGERCYWFDEVLDKATRSLPLPHLSGFKDPILKKWLSESYLAFGSAVPRLTVLVSKYDASQSRNRSRAFNARSFIPSASFWKASLIMKWSYSWAIKSAS